MENRRYNSQSSTAIGDFKGASRIDFSHTVPSFIEGRLFESTSDSYGFSGEHYSIVIYLGKQADDNAMSFLNDNSWWNAGISWRGVSILFRYYGTDADLYGPKLVKAFTHYATLCGGSDG